MSEQDGTQSSTKQRRSRKISSGKQNGKQATIAQHPTNGDTEAWKAYWKERGQPWRTEPEIDVERQVFLEGRRSITPDIKQGIYPFKDIKLSRADVEWLLVSHENGRGPVDWSDENQRKREGIDLRGADLSGENLRGLPLMFMRGGLTISERRLATKEQCEIASIHLEGAHMSEADLMGAYLAFAHLEKVGLSDAHLERANLNSAHLEEAICLGAHFEGASLYGANLAGVNLRRAYFDEATIFENVILNDEHSGTVSLSDIKWSGVNLAIVDWSKVVILGDEYKAQQPKYSNGEAKDKNRRIREYETSVRANRQLAVALQAQGMNEIAARFAYRAQLLQRKVFWYQRKFGQYLFSLFLDLLTGYGYKPIRSFITYILVNSVFATIYFLLGSHLAWNEAVVISMTAFHGRGFFPDQFHPGDPQALVAAIEAFVGLLIEVTFIATLTQRLFGK